VGFFEGSALFAKEFTPSQYSRNINTPPIPETTWPNQVSLLRVFTNSTLEVVQKSPFASAPPETGPSHPSLLPHPFAGHTQNAPRFAATDAKRAQLSVLAATQRP
jgi:hypothetical protein